MTRHVPQRQAGRTARGFTLVELLVGMAVASLLAMVAVPSFAEITARMRLEGAMSSLGSDIQYARSEALRRRATVNFRTNAGGNTYTIFTGTVATPNVLKTVTLGNGLGLSSSVAVAYDPMRNFADAATSVTASASGTSASLRAVINAVGRLQVCSPSGSFKGYVSC